MSAPPPRTLCFCGAPQAPELDYYCSIKCAREDALNALTLGAPHTSDQPPPAPLPTLPPDFFKPPVVGRGSYRSISSSGSDGDLPSHDFGPFLHPRSKTDAVVPRADASKPAHASCFSTRSSRSDEPRWKSHYRRLREKESPHAIPDAIQRAFQTASASASATDDSFASSSAASSPKGKLTQKMVNDALRASFGQPAPAANDLEFFDSSPLQNPRKLIPGQSVKSSASARSTSRPTSTRGVSPTFSTLCPTIPPGLDFAAQSLSSVFGRSVPSLHVHVTTNETPAALCQDLRVPIDAGHSIESSTIESNNATPLEPPMPLSPLAKQPYKGGAARLFLPLRRTGSQLSFSNQNPPQRLPFPTDVPHPTSTATQSSTRLGVVVRQSVLSTKRRLPIGGGPTKPSTNPKPGDSRAARVPYTPQRPVRETEVPKMPLSSAIEVEDASASDATSERFSAYTRRTMTSVSPTAPSSNTLAFGVCSVSATPKLNQTPSLFLERSEKTFTSVHDDGREMDVSSPCTSECPVTPADSAFTLEDSQLHPSAPVEWNGSKRSMDETDVAVFNLHRRFESAMDLDEVTPIGEKRFAFALQRE